MAPFMIKKLVFREGEGFFYLRLKKLSQRALKHTTIVLPQKFRNLRLTLSSL